MIRFKALGSLCQFCPNAQIDMAAPMHATRPSRAAFDGEGTLGDNRRNGPLHGAEDFKISRLDLAVVK